MTVIIPGIMHPKERTFIIHPKLNRSYSKWFLNKIDKNLTHRFMQVVMN